jgi:hypothetical protein
MKQVRTRIKEFYSELVSTHDYYTKNGLWSGDVYELKEEFEKKFQSELSGGGRKIKQ